MQLFKRRFCVMVVVSEDFKQQIQFMVVCLRLSEAPTELLSAVAVSLPAKADGNKFIGVSSDVDVLLRCFRNVFRNGLLADLPVIVSHTDTDKHTPHTRTGNGHTTPFISIHTALTTTDCIILNCYFAEFMIRQVAYHMQQSQHAVLTLSQPCTSQSSLCKGGARHLALDFSRHFHTWNCGDHFTEILHYVLPQSTGVFFLNAIKLDRQLVSFHTCIGLGFLFCNSVSSPSQDRNRPCNHVPDCGGLYISNQLAVVLEPAWPGGKALGW